MVLEQEVQLMRLIMIQIQECLEIQVLIHRFFNGWNQQELPISDTGLDVINGLPIRFQDSSGAPFVSLKSPSALSGNVALTLPSSITMEDFYKQMDLVIYPFKL